MPLANTAQIVRTALANGYAIGGFEPYTLEQIQATIEAAEAERAPVIIQLWPEVVTTWGIPALAAVVRELGARASVPVALHLDHATDDEMIDHALASGFTSVMFDGSTLPFEENIARTRSVVQRAREFGVAVEAELGLIGFLGDYLTPKEAMEAARKLLTTPEQAATFVRETRIDILAPAIGSIHGCSLPMAELDIPRIRAIAQATGVPLALHGGSGVGEKMVKAAIQAGVAKVNVDAEVRGVYIAALKEAVTQIGTGERDSIDLARYPRTVREVVKEAVRMRIRMLDATGRV